MVERDTNPGIGRTEFTDTVTLTSAEYPEEALQVVLAQVHVGAGPE
jgi:hypothetical protein